MFQKWHWNANMIIWDPVQGTCFVRITLFQKYYTLTVSLKIDNTNIKFGNFRCDLLQSTLKEVEQRIDDVCQPGSNRSEELLWDFQRCCRSLQQLKMHNLRAVRQDKARTDVIERLRPGMKDIYLHMDFAMKFIPRLHREPQRAWFGQKVWRKYVAQ